MHYFLYGIASSELLVALHYFLCRTSNRGWESGCLLPKAICLNNAVETELRIIFNMNEKLEPFEKADGGFSRTSHFPCFPFALTMFPTPGRKGTNRLLNHT